MRRLWVSLLSVVLVVLASGTAFANAPAGCTYYGSQFGFDFYRCFGISDYVVVGGGGGLPISTPGSPFGYGAPLATVINPGGGENAGGGVGGTKPDTTTPATTPTTDPDPDPTTDPDPVKPKKGDCKYKPPEPIGGATLLTVGAAIAGGVYAAAKVGLFDFLSGLSFTLPFTGGPETAVSPLEALTVRDASGSNPGVWVTIEGVRAQVVNTFGVATRAWDGTTAMGRQSAAQYEQTVRDLVTPVRQPGIYMAAPAAGVLATFGPPAALIVGGGGALGLIGIAGATGAERQSSMLTPAQQKVMAETMLCGLTP